MDTTKIQQSVIEKNLKSLMSSLLMRENVYKHLVGEIEKHMDLMQQASMTGRPTQLMKHAVEDTQFYFTLTRLLNEVQCLDYNEAYEKLGLVYQWFLSNRRQLYLGPRFGKAKKKSPKIPEWKSRKSKSAISRERIIAGWEMNKAASEPGLYPRRSVKEPEANGALREYDQEDENYCEDGTKQQKENIEIFQTELSDEQYFVRRKLPLSHLHNPLARALAKMDEKQSQEKMKATKPSKLATPRSVLMERWDQIKNQYNAEQETLGELQHLGRSGTAGTVRYTAHDQGPAVERTADEVLSHFNQSMREEDSISFQSEKPAFQTATLEDFYKFNDVKNLLVKESEPKLCQGSGTEIIGSSSSPRVTSSRSLRRPISVASSVRRPISSTYTSSLTLDSENAASSVKVDDVLSVINDVTSDMTLHKEKLLADPKPGFRKPTVKLQLRPKTAPAGCNSIVSEISNDAPSTIGSAPAPKHTEILGGAMEGPQMAAVEYSGKDDVRIVPRFNYSFTPHARPTSVVSQPKTETDIFINRIEDDEPDETNYQEAPVEDAIRIFRLNTKGKKARPPQYTPSIEGWPYAFERLNLDDFFYIKDGAPLEYFTFCSSMSRRGTVRSTKEQIYGHNAAEMGGKHKQLPNCEANEGSKETGENGSHLQGATDDIPAGLTENRQLIEEINRLLGLPPKRVPKVEPSVSSRLPEVTEETESHADALCVPNVDTELLGDSAVSQSFIEKGSVSQINKTDDGDRFDPSQQTIDNGPKDHLNADLNTESDMPLISPRRMNKITPQDNTSHTELKLTPGFKHRLYQRTFQSNPLKPDISSDLRLTVMGGQRAAKDTRARTCRTTPKIRPTSPTEEKRKELEILRRSKEAARTPRSAPSIPCQGQGQAIRLRGPYQKELESHARLHPKSLAFMEKIETLRQQDSAFFPADDDLTSRDLRTSPIKIHTLRSQTGAGLNANSSFRNARHAQVRSTKSTQ